jgi:hypothetical protein
MSSTKLSLDQEYIIDGVTVTGEQIKEALIENAIFRKHLQGDD